MKLTDLPVRLLTQYRPMPVSETIVSRKYPNGRTRLRPMQATPLFRTVTARDGGQSSASIHDLLQTAIAAFGLSPRIATHGEESEALALIRMAAQEGLIVLKRSDKGEIRGAWLRADYRPRKARKSKAERAREILAARLADLGTAIGADTIDDIEALLTGQPDDDDFVADDDDADEDGDDVVTE